ncbi:MAG: LamG domain-containing protein [Planctomycetota bacterium]
MCKKLLLLISASLVFGPVGNGFAETPPGAVAVYCFESGTTDDFSGNNNHATLRGGASIGGDGVLRFNNGALVPSGVIGIMGGGGPWTLYLKGFSGTPTAEMTSIVCIGSDGKQNSIVLYQRGGNFETDIWYENMSPVSSSVNFYDGARRDWFISYDGITWRLYNGSSEVGSGGLSYGGFGGAVYIGTPGDWPLVQDDMNYNAPSGSVEAMAIYDRVLNATERTDLMNSVCILGPRIGFESAASGALESASPALINICLNNPQAETYTVDYCMAGGTATNGVDYHFTCGTLTFNPGQTCKTISIDIVNDGEDEDDETIVAELSNPTGPNVELGDLTQHTYTIIDPRPAVGFDSPAGSELEDAGSANITVLLSAASGETVTVDYAITGGTATNGVDYALTEFGTLTFNPGETVKNLVVSIVADELEEDDETVILRLSNWTNAKAGDYTEHTLTIREKGISLLKGACYQKLNSGEPWESYSRTGPYADVEVSFEDANNKFVFWRASSYLPHWRTESGMWYVQEVVPRSGDGTGLMPDRVNQYSHIRVVESSRARAVVHWRYVPNFGNPNWDGWVDEYFTVYPDGVCIRTVRQGAAKLDDWLDPSNVTIQKLKLEVDGIAPLPVSWQSVPELLLSGPSVSEYNDDGFDETKRCYVLRCKKNGMPSTLNLTLDTTGGKSIHHPAIVVNNWGDAGVAVAVDGWWCGAYQTGYIHHPKGTDLILWLRQSSSNPVSVSISPIGGTTPDNRSPQVNAGEDRSILVASGASGPYLVELEGIVEDDGLPNGTLTVTWSKVDGPGSADFVDVNDSNTTVSLSLDGTYQLRLTANDGALGDEDDVVVVVKKDPGVVASPVAWWKLDEGSGDSTEESVGPTMCSIGGPKTVWKAGVSGAALQFDGYNSVVTLPAAQAPSVSSGLTVEAWVAVGARPWNWAPIAHQSNWQSTGYYLGLDAYGHLGFMVSVGGSWQTLVSSAPLERYKWTHVVGTFDSASARMHIYINGTQAGSIAVPGSNVSTANVDLLIGRNNTAMTPTDAVRDYATLPTMYGFDGLIDEVKIYDRQLSSPEVLNAYNKNVPGALVRDNPAMQQRILPAGPAGPARFGAYYDSLKYYETWDNMWRVSEHPDVVVKFDEAPASVVFWRGTTYGSGWVTEDNKWVSFQSVEEGADEVVGCAEHMSDKQCRHSRVRIIESTDARVVVHWRYALVDILYQKPRYDGGTGWSDWVDEYYTIYPDGVGIRNAKYWSSVYGHYSPQATFFLNPPGVRPEEDVYMDALIVVNPSGQVSYISWAVPDPYNPLSNANIEIANLRSTYKPFVIYEPSIHIYASGGGDEKTDYSEWLTFNHFPAAQILSDGRKARDPDHLTHSALSEIDVDDTTADIYMYGLTNASPASLVPLGKSWNSPPSLNVTSGGFSSQGYDRGQRAYVLERTSPDATTLQFTLNGSTNSPIVNPCFTIKNWDSHAHVSLRLDGQEVKPGPDFRRGIENSTSGQMPSLVVWIKKEATSPISITITKNEILGDFDDDCDVDSADLAGLVARWLDSLPGCQDLEGDLDGDCQVNFKDYALLALRWLDRCP